jgi:hypothetical protein
MISFKKQYAQIKKMNADYDAYWKGHSQGFQSQESMLCTTLQMASTLTRLLSGAIGLRPKLNYKYKLIYIYK